MNKIFNIASADFDKKSELNHLELVTNIPEEQKMSLFNNILF